MSAPAIALTYGIAVFALVVVVVLVRRHSLRERYAVIWVALSIGMLVLAISRPLLDDLSEALGIQSGVTTLVVLSLLVVLGILLQISVSVSRLERAMQDVAEALALHVAESAGEVEDSEHQ